MGSRGQPALGATAQGRQQRQAAVFFFLAEMPADNELSAILNRRNQINDTLDNGGEVKQRYAKVSVYTEFTNSAERRSKTLRPSSHCTMFLGVERSAFKSLR